MGNNGQMPKKKPAAKRTTKKASVPAHAGTAAPKNRSSTAAAEAARPIASVVPDGGLAALLRLPQGPVDLTRFDAGFKEGFPGKNGKDDADDVQSDMLPKLTELQERLFANGRSNPTTAPRLLLLLQGMDTSG